MVTIIVYNLPIYNMANSKHMPYKHTLDIQISTEHRCLNLHSHLLFEVFFVGVPHSQLLTKYLLSRILDVYLNVHST